MVLKISTIAFILLATFTVIECKRIRIETQAQIAAERDEEDTEKIVVEDEADKAFEDRATSAAEGTEANLARSSLESPAALVQEEVAGGSNLSAFWHWKSLGFSFPGEVRKQVLVAPNETPSSFSKTLDYLRNASATWVSRFTILKTACDSSAFSCEEIIQLANSCWPDGPWQELWQNPVMVFAKGRSNAGCISDPANAKSIVNFFERKWHDGQFIRTVALGQLKQAFNESGNLKPAKDVGPPPMQLQTGLRTDEDMHNLLRGIEAMKLSKAFESQGPRGLHALESWLKQIRSNGEQFSGPQLVTLVNSIPKSNKSSQAVSTVLQYLEQYVTGVTCEELRQIMKQIDVSTTSRFLSEGIDALKSSIVDGQNKVDIVALADLISSAHFKTRQRHEFFLQDTVDALKDVGVGLPPRNNPIFGVVKGNPVILVVDESTSMEADITLGNDTFTRWKFCHSQLETVLAGLPKGIYFNVIQYSSSAVMIFERPVRVSKANINAAMEAMGTTWRSDYTPRQDPIEMLQDIKVFALRLKNLGRSVKRNVSEALRLAYATAGLPAKQQRGGLPAAKGLPQIYFVTSGQPDGGARQVLDKIGKFDNRRNIPVNSISFNMLADPVAKRFVKDLANKTGGFFRSIEQASL